MGPVLNYTTKVSARQTANEISAYLSTHGARRLSIDLDAAGNPTGLSFVLEASWGRGEYALPVNVAPVERALLAAYTAGGAQWAAGGRRPDRAQAERVAWRICKDWIESQLAVVESGLMTADQALFPYLLADGAATVYERFVQMKALPAGGRQ